MVLLCACGSESGAPVVGANTGVGGTIAMTTAGAPSSMAVAGNGSTMLPSTGAAGAATRPSGAAGATPSGAAGSTPVMSTAGAAAMMPPPTTMPGDMTGMMPATPYHDPGMGAWEVVPMADVMSVCKLDPAELMAAESRATYPWLVVRYGKVCWEHNAMSFRPTEAWSTTKTLGALVTGMASYQTRDIKRTGKKTGQLSDLDRADQWLDNVTYNKDAQVAHVLGMVAHDASLAEGSKSFAYDTVGTTEINTLGTMISNAIKQDATRLGTSVADFTQKFLYTPLGMKNSSWAGSVYAYSWSVDLLDMARVGILINNYGVWSGERLVDAEWIYRQTHPSFEDANTGFGYLTWLNSRSNWTSISGGKQQMPGTPGTCAPVAIHKSYPHGASTSKDCGYTAPATCEQKYDVGVWNAEGLGGQLIQGHRALDLVIVARDAQPGGTGPGTAKDVWDALRMAVIKGDPMFKGDEAAFCKAYGANDYAPDLHM
ncbi:MAG TPA: hypothetical protein VFG30_34400 [Polyangiales bacterium]|nr:hypothetical protein [Polyangiales bacterium]